MEGLLIPGDKLGKVIISKEYIEAREARLVEAICRDHADANPILMCVKEGAKYFFDDLCWLLEQKDFKFEKAWITTSSYSGNSSTGSVQVSDYQGPDMADRHVIIVEDIVDTALTIKMLADYLRTQGVAGFDMCALLFKKRKQNLLWRIMGLRSCFGFPKIRYVGAFIDNHFVVGKGLDYDNYGRGYEEVCILLPEGQAWVDEQAKQKKDR